MPNTVLNSLLILLNGSSQQAYVVGAISNPPDKREMRCRGARGLRPGFQSRQPGSRLPLPMPPFWVSSWVCKGGAAGLVAAWSRVAAELTRHLGVRPSHKHRLARISRWDPELARESSALGRQGLSLPPVGVFSKARGDRGCGKPCAVMNLVVRRAMSALRARSFLSPNQNTHLPRRFCLAPVGY